MLSPVTWTQKKGRRTFINVRRPFFWAVEVLVRALSDEGSYLDLAGTYLFRKYGIAIGVDDHVVRSASLGVDGYYDSLIEKYGISRLTRRIQ